MARLSARRLAPLALIAAALVALVAVRVWVPKVQQPGAAPSPLSAPSASSTPAAPLPPAPSAEPPVVATEPALSAAAKRDIDFEDVTGRVGLHVDPAAYRPTTGLESMSSGVGYTRLHGKPAVLLTGPTGNVQLFVWDGSRFRDRTKRAGLASAGTASSAAFADLDGDGDEDLILGRHQTATVSIYRNDGHDHFADVTKQSGVQGASTNPYGAEDTAIRGIGLADVNNDGHLDLFLADWNPAAALGYATNPGPDPDQGACISAQDARDRAPTHTSQSRLYLGDGHGHFRDATKAWGLDLDQVFAYTPQFVDLDGDGWLDLVLTSDFCTSRVFHNDHGKRFVDVTSRTTPGLTPFGMGSVIRDLNGDGRPDWLATGISYPTRDGSCPYISQTTTGCTGNRAYLGGPGLSFTDVTDRLGVRRTGWGWGVVAEDFGNTGELEIGATNGIVYADRDLVGQWRTVFDYFAHDQMSFFLPNGSGPMVDGATQVGLTDRGQGHALLAFDYDGDGRLDLLVNDSASGPHLYRNVTPTAGRHWLDIRLDDETTPTNRSAWGAEISVAGHPEATCWVTSATSYETDWPGDCHVGLGSSTAPVTVEVRWPGQRTATSYAVARVDRVVTLTRSSR
jgi:hypothetical protein